MGRRLATLPIDPRLGRMLVEADRNGCASDVLVIVAALSIQDPRERPPEAREAADQSHRRYVDPTSDFITYLNMWVTWAFSHVTCRAAPSAECASGSFPLPALPRMA